jgi:hypothetical protein
MKWTHVVIFALICVIVALAWFNIKMKQEILLQEDDVNSTPVVVDTVPPTPTENTPLVEEPTPIPEKPEGNDVGMEYPETDITTGDTFPVACTMDAKICPDGSAVGRVGPNCEFAPCP